MQRGGEHRMGAAGEVRDWQGLVGSLGPFGFSLRKPAVTGGAEKEEAQHHALLLRSGSGGGAVDVRASRRAAQGWPGAPAPPLTSCGKLPDDFHVTMGMRSVKKDLSLWQKSL